MTPRVLACALAAASAFGVPQYARATTAVPAAADLWAGRALGFEVNRGQFDDRAAYVARGDGYQIFLTDDGEAVVVLRSVDEPISDAGVPASGSVVRIRPLRTLAPALAAGEEELASPASYFLGHDPSRWHTRVASYARVRYSDVYPGVDLVYYGNQRRLEFDFVVAPGADRSEIALQIEGAEKVERTPSGALRLAIGKSSVEIEAPVVYQLTAGGEREPVAGGYVVEKGVGGDADADVIRFELAAYDTGRELVIDPILSYSSYLGGFGPEQGQAITTDASGHVYIAGKTISVDFPEQNACQDCGSGSTVPTADDAFVAKLDPEATGGASLLWSTYLGGNDTDTGQAIAVDGTGAVYVTGKAESTNFPNTNNAFQGSLIGGDEEFNAFVAKLSADGATLVYATYLGGNNTQGSGIALLEGGAAGPLAVVVGSTTSEVKDFPVNGGFQPARCNDDSISVCTTSGAAGDLDGFVTVFNANGTGVITSSYLGRLGGDEALDVVAAGSGSVYVVGRTAAQNFPTTAGAYAEVKAPADEFTSNGFVVRVDVDVTLGAMTIGYGSYVPGGAIVARGVDLDTAGNIHVAGSIQFGSTFETTLDAVQPTPPGGTAGQDGFALKLNAAGSALVYSTYLGGTGADAALDVAVDALGNAHVVGTTASSNFPTMRPVQAARGGSNDVFVSKLSADGSALVYSTYLGGGLDDQGRGVATGADGVTYLVGFSTSTDFPTAGGFQSSIAGSIDAIVAKISDTVGSACLDSPECDDADVCNGVETCVGGFCEMGTALSCEDDNICTDNTCEAAVGCVFTNNAAGCGDGDACNGAETCADGACQPGTALSCDDGDACNGAETCAGGVCQAGTALNCDDGNVCTDNACDSVIGCLTTNNTAACNDGNACTTGDTCSSGSCAGTGGVDCNDDNPCTDDTCDAANECFHTNNTAACDDLDACTIADTCGGGACAGGPPLNCDDGNTCTGDVCSPASGCLYEDLDILCNDGNVCTQTDICTGGFCVGMLPLDCNDSNSCTNESCDPVLGCVISNVTGFCDDGTLCTVMDSCVDGACIGAEVTCEEAGGADLPAGGGTVTTDDEVPADGATIGDDLETTVTTNVAGQVAIAETPLSRDGLAASIVAPDVAAASPHLLTFVIEGTLGLSGSVLVSADGSVVRPCEGASTAPAPCILSRATLPDGDLEIVANAWSGGEWRFAALAVCEMTPAVGCRSGAKSNVLIADKVDDTTDKDRFRIRQGEAVAHSELGDPRADTVYGLCVYDTRVATHTLVDAFVLPAGSSAWLDRSPTGYLYSDPSGAVRGVQRLRLKAAAAGSAAVKFRAAGAAVGFPVPADVASMFSQDPTVAVRVVGSNGICWTVDYPTAATRTNDPARYRAVLP